MVWPWTGTAVSLPVTPLVRFVLGHATFGHLASGWSAIRATAGPQVGRAGPGEPAARCCWRRRAACSRRGGAGLVVDDLQWADASSIWIPEAVLPRLVGVGAVLVYRPDELVPGNAASTFVTRARANVTVIELHPLDVNASPNCPPTMT